MSTREAIASAHFWQLSGAFFCVAMTASGATAHLIPLLTDHGVPTAQATRAISAAGIALIAGRLVAGAMLDRFFAPNVALAFFLMPLAGIIMLLSTVSMQAGLVAAMLVGLGLGAEIDLIAFLQSRYFGLRAFGALYGYLFAIFMLGSGIGPWVMGLSFTRFGNYTPALWLFAAVLVLACSLMWQLGPYAFGPTSDRSSS
ncbi:hypothetical protein JQ604_26480 [Bradyrhizobium jicamae]|nr:hypothetical protein [Bradyrhizobium jicamae]MBR0755735.1 hypothetical protein [Bradyrhizobium jicamae]